MIRRMLVPGALAALGTVCLPVLMSGDPQARPASYSVSTVARAQRLATAPLPRLGMTPALTPVQARVYARRRARELPLPNGGNFDGIDWRQARPAIDVGQLESVLQANAFCQWFRAASGGPEAATAARVLATVPEWPAFRGREAPDPSVPAVAAECWATRAREQERLRQERSGD